VKKRWCGCNGKEIKRNERRTFGDVLDAEYVCNYVDVDNLYFSLMSKFAVLEDADIDV
jgi:hypothetical protein